MASDKEMSDSAHWLGLRGKVAVVTGAGSGIGAAVAQALAAAGAAVALVDRELQGAQALAQGIQAGGAKAMALACDTSDEAQVLQAAGQVREHLGTCDVLVNNAGIMRAAGVEDVKLADWQAVLNVNLTGYLLCTRAFGADMLARGGGSIVHIASISGTTPQSRSGAYSASKAGVLLLSRQIAVEWGPRGIRSNAICPGMIRTALTQKFYEEPGFEARRSLATASRRIGEPGDIANAALFLASERAAYCNGAELLVDGGLSSMIMDMVPRPGYNQT